MLCLTGLSSSPCTHSQVLKAVLGSVKAMVPPGSLCVGQYLYTGNSHGLRLSFHKLWLSRGIHQVFARSQRFMLTWAPFLQACRGASHKPLTKTLSFFLHFREPSRLY